MKQTTTIFEHNHHRWDIIARDPERADSLIDTNEYLISDHQESILLDPGGAEIFPAVFSALVEKIDPRNIKWLFASHQDPDIISSLALWLEVNPDMKCYISRLWSGFIPHFGGNANTLIGLPDEGSTLTMGSLTLQTVPAHYLHASGNFHLYDPQAHILFSGDVGAALLPNSDSEIFVENFDRHIQYAEGFHKRWMGSNEAKQKWCERVSKMQIDMLCPQHGAIYQGDDVMRFINWFADLNVASGLEY